VLRVVERAILGAGMTLVAFVVERKLLKALRKGGTAKLKPALDLEPVAQVTAARQQGPDEG
jgi:hypothetical protein